MKKTTAPDVKKVAGELNRLYRERDRYLEEAANLKNKALDVRQGGGKPEEYNGLIDQYNQAVAWSVGLQPQIDRASSELQQAIGSLNW